MNGLVLEGGGARGSYHVGAVKALRKRHIQINYVVGTSIGSINGAFVASNDYKKLENLWKTSSSKELFGVDDEITKAIQNKNITKDIIKSGLQTVFQIIKNAGIDTTPLRNALIANIDEEKLRNSDIEYGLATYNISKREKVRIFKEDIPKGKLIEYLIASSYLPIFKMEKIVDDSYYFDGGIFDVCPVDMLLDKNLDNIYVVRAHRHRLPNYKTDSNIVIIKSYEKLGSIVTFDKDVTDYNIKLGYYDTIKALDKLDGNKYYFKPHTEEYYKSILSDKHILRKYNRGLIINNKDTIINTIENICDLLNIKRFRIYNMELLILYIKLRTMFTKTPYDDFIKVLKVKF